MMDAARLRELCTDLRSSGNPAGDDLVDSIEADVTEYRDTYRLDDPPAMPPEPLRELLPLMGWLIYETSWNALRKVQAAFESMDDGPRRTESVHAYGQVRRLADAARGLVWPQFAPRALGAIRAQALAESKRDTEAGYDAAYIVHQEARDRYWSYRATLGGDPLRELALDEVMLQLALAETGTACRTAERVIARWSEDFPGATYEDEERWVQRMYRDLSEAVKIGGTALDTARTIKDQHGLVDEANEERLAKVTGYRNPGIMTARAALLALALCPAMEHIGRQPANGTWAHERDMLVKHFTRAYRAIEEPVTNADSAPMPLIPEHQRALVQLRLNMALLVPGHPLPAVEPFDPCLKANPLDDEAVTAMSNWLATAPSDGGPNHGNIIGSATLPLFNQSVVALRSLTGDGPGYYRWRHAWFPLGRYATQAGRKERVTAALHTAAERESLRVGGE
jgi:hypothetical protein